MDDIIVNTRIVCVDNVRTHLKIGTGSALDYVRVWRLKLQYYTKAHDIS